MSRDCPVRTILAIVGFAAAAGVSPPKLLRAAGLEPSQLDDPDAYFPYAQELRLWDAAARLSGDQDFGIHLAEWATSASFHHFDMLTFAARSSSTLREQFRLAGRHIRVIHDGIYLRLEEDGDLARLVHGHRVERRGPRQPVEGLLALMLLHGRAGVGEDLEPRAVCFAHGEPDRVSEQERVFRAPVRYGCARNELVFERALLDRPLLHADQRLHTLLDRQLGALVPAQPEGRSFLETVMRCMTDELPEREPTVAVIANRLRMSGRSLQRRLRQEGTSFTEALSDLRRDRALRYLQDRRLSIGEVAFSLGYLDVSAFHRAFKRWTGTTPTEYRAAVPRGPRARGSKT